MAMKKSYVVTAVAALLVMAILLVVGARRSDGPGDLAPASQGGSQPSSSPSPGSSAATRVLVDRPSMVGHMPPRREELTSNVAAVERSPARRPKDTEVGYQQRVLWSHAYLDWVAEARLTQEREYQVRLALADFTTQFWLLAYTPDIQLTEEREALAESFSKRLAEILTPEQVALFDQRFADGAVLMASRVVESDDLQRMLEERMAEPSIDWSSDVRTYKTLPPDALLVRPEPKK